MTFFYRMIAVLPFEWARGENMFFMKHALLAILLVSPIFGILSTMIVSNQMAFFSDALGHGAFTGIILGDIFGFSLPLWSAILFSILFSFSITIVRNKSKMSSDTVIGVFSSAAVALGIFLSTLGGKSFAKLIRFLVGELFKFVGGSSAGCFGGLDFLF
jgi:zinc transport system permease protein